MKKHKFIQIKAAFLLLVFAFNTVVGFACGIGLDMGFNVSHHKAEKGATKVHVHADGTKHQHESGKHNHSKKSGQENGGCCTNDVVKLAQTDKAIPQVACGTNPVFAIAFITIFHCDDIFYTSQVTESAKYFARGYHPPIPDIRIAIQSFQI